jgi:hypothetical protein
MEETSSRNLRKRRLLIGAIGFAVGFVIYFAIGWFVGDRFPSWVFGGKYPTLGAVVVGLFGSAIALASAEKRGQIPTADAIRAQEVEGRRNPIGIKDSGGTHMTTTTQERS